VTRAPTPTLPRAGGARSLLAGALCFATAACTDAYAVRLEPRTDPPVEVFLDGTIRMPVGVAVVVSAQPYKDADRMPAGTIVELVPELPAVLGVAPVDLPPEDAGLEEDEGEGDWGYAFWGASHGTTDVVVYIDGEEQLRIDAAVSGL
jgi:hypothetical protein